MLLAGDRDGGHVVEAAGLRRSPACRASHQASRVDLGAVRVAAPRPERTSAPVSASRMTTLQDWVDESTPATSVIGRRRCAEQVLDRELVEADEAEAAGADRVGVEVLERAAVGSRSA